MAKGRNQKYKYSGKYKKSQAQKPTPQNIQNTKESRRKVRRNENIIHPSEYKPIKSPFVFGIILALTFILYSNTIPFGYVLDDGIVVSKNKFTQRGLEGLMDIFSYDTMAGEHGKDVNFVAGGRYRPASVALLAIEWEFFATGCMLTPEKYAELKKEQNIPEQDYKMMRRLVLVDKDKNKFDSKDDFKNQIYTRTISA